MFSIHEKVKGLKMWDSFDQNGKDTVSEKKRVTQNKVEVIQVEESFHWVNLSPLINVEDFQIEKEVDFPSFDLDLEIKVKI